MSEEEKKKSIKEQIEEEKRNLMQEMMDDRENTPIYFVRKIVEKIDKDGWTISNIKMDFLIFQKKLKLKYGLLLQMRYVNIK